jgi:Xaa-Pro aminopeptidase
MRLSAGMVFHLMSWLLRREHGDSFLSDTVIVTEEGAEVVTQTSRDIAVRA